MNDNAWPRCPHLSLVDDPALYCTFPNEAHRCYRRGKGQAIPWDKQDLLCLSDGYRACPGEPGAPKPAARLKTAPYLAALAGVLLLAAALLVWARGYLAVAPTAAAPATLNAPAPPSAPTAEPPPPTALPPAPSTPLALPAPGTSPSAPPPPPTPPQPTATPQRLPSTPTPLPGTRRVHVVAPGETLWSISLQYGTSIDALARANGLADRNFIWSGQRLIIP